MPIAAPHAIVTPMMSTNDGALMFSSAATPIATLNGRYARTSATASGSATSLGAGKTWARMAVKTAAAIAPQRIPHAAPTATPLATSQLTRAWASVAQAVAPCLQRASRPLPVDVRAAPIDLPIHVAPPERPAEQVRHGCPLPGG